MKVETETERMLTGAWEKFMDHLWGVQLKMGLEGQDEEFRNVLGRYLGRDVADGYIEWANE